MKLCEAEVEEIVGERSDAMPRQLILRLLLEDRFPRIWVPSWENRDLPTVHIENRPNRCLEFGEQKAHTCAIA